jgi:bla regulator protein blaR1
VSYPLSHPQILSRKITPVIFRLISIGLVSTFAIYSSRLQAQLYPEQQAPSLKSPVHVIPDWQTAAGDKMAFEVATIRPAKPDTFTPSNFPLSADDSYMPNGGRLSADFPLSTYIAFAYKLTLTPEQEKTMLADLPKWVGEDRFVIHAQAEGSPTKDQMRLMMQSLLADRFKLAVHFETREVPVFGLVLRKPGVTGPKLRPHAEGPPCDVHPSDAPKLPAANVAEVFPPECDSYMAKSGQNKEILVGSRNTTLELIAASLGLLGHLGRPIVDQTGLVGRFDFTIQWTPESNDAQPPGGEAQPESQGSTFLEALNEELGLKLKPTRAPLKVLVVDHVERPSDN